MKLIREESWPVLQSEVWPMNRTVLAKGAGGMACESVSQMQGCGLQTHQCQ